MTFDELIKKEQLGFNNINSKIAKKMENQYKEFSLVKEKLHELSEGAIKCEIVEDKGNYRYSCYIRTKVTNICIEYFDAEANTITSFGVIHEHSTMQSIKIKIEKFIELYARGIAAGIFYDYRKIN